MNDHIAEIDQNPFSEIFPFHAQRLDSVLFSFLDHVAGEGFHMSLRGSRGDHHEVGNTGFATYIDDFYIASLAVIQSGQYKLK